MRSLGTGPGRAGKCRAGSDEEGRASSPLRRMLVIRAVSQSWEEGLKIAMKMRPQFCDCKANKGI